MVLGGTDPYTASRYPQTVGRRLCLVTDPPTGILGPSVKPIRDVADRPLDWTIPRGTFGPCELRAGVEVVAAWTMRLSSVDSVESADGCWTFEWRGLIRRTITVKSREIAIAVLERRLTGRGTLECSTGATYKWRRGGWVLPEGGEPLVRFVSFPFVAIPASRSRRMVVIAPAARSLPELQLLVVLGCYVKIDTSLKARMS